MELAWYTVSSQVVAAAILLCEEGDAEKEKTVILLITFDELVLPFSKAEAIDSR